MQIELGGQTLEFSDCLEICQGGPEACSMSINGEAIDGRRFDPSPLVHEGKILIPMRKSGFLRSGYVLVRIDPSSLAMESISKVHDYMKLCRTDGESVEFATAVWGSETALLTLP